MTEPANDSKSMRFQTLDDCAETARPVLVDRASSARDSTRWTHMGKTCRQRLGLSRDKG